MTPRLNVRNLTSPLLLVLERVCFTLNNLLIFFVFHTIVGGTSTYTVGHCVLFVSDIRLVHRLSMNPVRRSTLAKLNMIRMYLPPVITNSINQHRISFGYIVSDSE